MTRDQVFEEIKKIGSQLNEDTQSIVVAFASKKGERTVEAFSFYMGEDDNLSIGAMKFAIKTVPILWPVLGKAISGIEEEASLN